MKKFVVKQIHIFRHNWELLTLCLPALVLYIMFNYVPMGGLVLAFKDYKFNLGIFKSPWIGLQNMKYLLTNPNFGRTIRNTVAYSVGFLVIGIVCEVFVALLLYEINHKASLKFFQTVMQFPRFMSWVIISFISYAIFQPTYGILNQLVIALGGSKVDVYTMPGIWPLILTVFNEWKAVGAGCILYYAALMGIDKSLYEAAAIDGAGRLKQIWYISLPELVPLMTMLLILGMGNILGGDFGLFYQITRDVGLLYPTTDILATYNFRMLQSSSFSYGTTVSLMSSVVGFVLTLSVNAIVKKINPEHAMF